MTRFAALLLALFITPIRSETDVMADISPYGDKVHDSSEALMSAAAAAGAIEAAIDELDKSPTIRKLRVLTSIMNGEPREIADAIDESSHTYYETWEDAPASWEEFGHDNDPSVCGIPVLSVEEWEEGRYWEREEPVLVRNATDGWSALEHWTKEEMLRRYPDGE